MRAEFIVMHDNTIQTIPDVSVHDFCRVDLLVAGQNVGDSAGRTVLQRKSVCFANGPEKWEEGILSFTDGDE